MLTHRLIPVLLLKDGGLVKTTKFGDPKYVGDPINVVRIFNEKEVDELAILDIFASSRGRAPDFELLAQIASECFMPLSYGGGIRSIDDAKRVFSLGIEKVCIQTAALQNIKIITEIARDFGTQSITVSVDIKKNWLGRRGLYSASAGKIIQGDWLNYLKTLEAAGAGEILLTSVERDGTLSGMDFELIREVSECLSIPVVAAGGASSLDDVRKAIDCGANAVAAGAFFVYQGPHRAVLISYPRYAELKRLMG